MSESDTGTGPRDDGIDIAAVNAFIDRWEKSGGELCDLLGLPRPDPSE